MLFFVPMSFLADTHGFIPFHGAPNAPFKYPGAHEPTYWLPDPHPYADAEVWPRQTEVDVSMYPWLSPVCFTCCCAFAS